MLGLILNDPSSVKFVRSVSLGAEWQARRSEFQGTQEHDPQTKIFQAVEFRRKITTKTNHGNIHMSVISGVNRITNK